MRLEICTNSYTSAFHAQRAGAHRIELCSALHLGGITPSYGLIRQVMENIHIPVFVLIRPRSGNFTYSDDAFKIMQKDIEFCKEIGCAGIVTGVLRENNTIDIERTKILLELAKPLDFTFHRAFDCVPDAKKELLALQKIGVRRILSSGQKGTALEGLPLLQSLQEIAQNSLTIMPGSGINSSNIQRFQESGFTEIHTSASKVIPQKPFFPEFDVCKQTVSDYAIIKDLIKRISNV